MRLLILSDLHLEFPAPQPAAVCSDCGERFGWASIDAQATWYNGYCGVCRQEARVTEPLHFRGLGNDWTLDLPDSPSFDVVALAGDIHKHTLAIPWAAKTFLGKDVIYVPGNHEYYGANLHRLAGELRALAADHPRIHFLDNDSVVIDGVRFVGATLWTDFRLHGDPKSVVSSCQREAAQCMPDFSVIRIGAIERFQPVHSVELFQASVKYLRGVLAAPFAGPTVVVTHHLPSMRSVATRYENDLVSAAFASHLDDLVVQADLWIHGHTHDSFDYEIGKCRVVCNPRGYPENRVQDSYENPMFDARKIVEISE